MSHDALQRFLTDATGEVESTSEFTIDPNSALEKLAAHQLPEPGLWAVKLVQGASAHGATSVRFVMEKSRLRFVCLHSDDVSAFNLLRHMCSGRWPERPSERHWVTALRGAYGLKLPQLSWISVVDDHRERVTISEAGIETEVSPATEDDKDVSFEVVAEYPSSLLNLRSACSDEHAALCVTCRLCAMPVYVDTRNISQHPPESSGSTYHPVVWEKAASDEEPAFNLNLGDKKRIVTLAGEKPLILHRVGPESRRCALLLTAAPCDSPTRARVSWIKDGILLGSYFMTFKSDANLHIVLPGDHVQTDLSEWFILESERTLPVLEILGAARQILAQLEANPKVNPPERGVTTSLIYGFGEVCAWIGVNALYLAAGGFSLDPLGWQKARTDNAKLLSAMRSLAAQTTLELEK